jgi:hypothetical protein
MISSSSRHAKNEAARALPSRALSPCASVTKPIISPPSSTSSRSAKYVYAVYSKPIYAKSSCASTPALASTYLRL